MEAEQSKTDQPQLMDFTEAFTAQRRKFRPWAWAFLIWIALTFFSPIVLGALRLDFKLYMNWLPFALILIVPLAARMYVASRCPGCGKYMGRDLSPHCSNCGALLRKEDDPVGTNPPETDSTQVAGSRD